MLNVEGSVATDRASRYLTQLGRHLDHMSDLDRRQADRGEGAPIAEQWSDTHGTMTFAGGQCTLHATPDALTLAVQATTTERLKEIQDGIARRIETLGRRDGLTVTWRQPRTSHAEPAQAVDTAPVRGAGTGRKRARTVGLIAAGVLVAAMHVGVLGAAVAASSWTTGIAVVVLALVALKVVAIGAHGVAGRLVIHRRRAR